jgi:hypothetical protein
VNTDYLSRRGPRLVTAFKFFSFNAGSSVNQAVKVARGLSLNP